MSPIGEQPIESRTTRRRTVTDVVELSGEGAGFAYVPGEVLVRGAAAERRLADLIGLTEEEREEGERIKPVSDHEQDRTDGRGWSIANRVDGVLEKVALLVAEGYDAQPNHVLFVHECGSPCPPHPALVHALIRSGLFASPMGANPMGANPMGANPMGANPMGANPMGANPMGANPMGANPMESTAVPAEGRRLAPRTLDGPGPRPHVVVLDTGLAGGADTTASAFSVAAVDHRPELLLTATTITGLPNERDLPDAAIEVRPNDVVPADNYLDPAAGHGTFIAGIIEQLAPGCTIDVRRVIGPLGDARESKVGPAIDTVVTDFKNDTEARPFILSMSFGGRALDTPDYLREAVARAVNAGIVVIASAGNDGVCTPQYPAAFPGVIAVAALGPDGPPPWTNYGDWVDACAPGVDLVSAFFDHWDGAFPTMNTYDPDRFAGWAKWSGTSFAVPVVVAAVARELVCGPPVDNINNNNDEVALLAAAVERVVHAPHLLRLPCLGTVVNI
jgi:Subtilase family